MGMAASQARYLALVARKSNCEYEGQQINQARLALSNQSADLFNQMLGMEVPKTPSKTDFTYTTYTYTDGDNNYTITKWNHLADASDGYNYVVTYDYKTTQSVGFQKYKSNPQVQFSGAIPTTSQSEQVAKLNAALNELREAQKEKNEAQNAYDTVLAQAKKKETYQDKSTFTGVKATKKEANDTYELSKGGYIYTNYSKLGPNKKAELKNDIDKLIEYGTFTKDEIGVDAAGNVDYSKIYYNNYTQSFAFRDDLDALVNSETGTILPIYHTDPDKKGTDETYHYIPEMIEKVNKAYENLVDANNKVDAKQAAYDKISSPSKIGNTKLKPIAKADMDDDMAAAIAKIIKQMQEEELDCTNLLKCFNTLDGTYNANTYIGGLYSFDWTTNTYYTTYYDLYNSVINGDGYNNVDDQPKLPYYGVQDTDKTITKESRALIEKDRTGRFVSIRMEDDSMVYDLTAVTETDEIGYEDAMNQYNYDKSVYDKAVQDLNAKTSIIQRQDKNLELRLKQLDTEQNALATEIDAVAKVVKDNIEKSFKTFSN